MNKSDLERICEMAKERLNTGCEPPWAWYQLMKLREACEALMAGMETVRPIESSGLRLVISDDKVQMPM